VHRADGFDFAVVCNLRPGNDDCAWNLRDAVDQAVSAVPAQAWPDYDLFPSVNLDYDAWTVAQFPDFLRAQLGMRTDFWGPAAKPDGDEIANLLKAYFQFDPFTPSQLPYQPLLENGDFVVRWSRSIFSSFNGVQLQSQYQTYPGPTAWLDGPAIEMFSGRGLSTMIYETRIPLTAHPGVIERFQATAP